MRRAGPPQKTNSASAPRMLLGRTSASGMTQVVEHPTSAVESHIYYEIEFVLTDDRFTEMEIALIKELQGLFEKL